MFSKSLFKQSCKANGTMWCIITFAVCFMLACVMLISGGGNIAITKNAIQDTIIQEELTSQIELRAMNYYNTANRALAHFDKAFSEKAGELLASEEASQAYTDALMKALGEGKTSDEATQIAMQAMLGYGLTNAYPAAAESLTAYVDQLIKDRGLEPDSTGAQEIKGLIFAVLNPPIPTKDPTDAALPTAPHMFDQFYEDMGEELPRYDVQSMLTMTEEERAAYRQDYATKYSIIFLSGNIIKPENVEMILEELSRFGVTNEKYEEFGFNQYDKIKNISTETLIDFRANYNHRMENLKDGETEEDVIKELTDTISMSLLASLPHEVSDALEEIGEADLYGTLIGSIFFKMAGLLLPIIYMIMTANSLIAGQVDSGSMAYVLSSSVKRRTVTFTQAVYLVGSLFLMFCCTAITSVVCLSIVEVDTSLNYGKILLMNLGAFIVMFAMSGICFLASCWFNRSKRSMAIGGGLNMFFLVATMLGLFGSPVLPSIIRMDALNNFNYVSIISLFDVIAILEGRLDFLWKFGILIAIGLVCYFVGSEKFARKDLPL